MGCRRGTSNARPCGQVGAVHFCLLGGMQSSPIGCQCMRCDAGNVCTMPDRLVVLVSVLPNVEACPIKSSLPVHLKLSATRLMLGALRSWECNVGICSVSKKSQVRNALPLHMRTQNDRKRIWAGSQSSIKRVLSLNDRFRCIATSMGDPCSWARGDIAWYTGVCWGSRVSPAQ